MFDVSNIEMADIVMLETDIPPEYHPEICKLLSNLRLDARILTYLDLRLIWPCDEENCQFCLKQVDVNRSITDRFPTSWSVQRGHHFYLWRVVPPHEVDLLPSQQDLMNTANIARGLDHINTLDGPPSSSTRISRAEERNKSGKSKDRKPILNFLRKIFSLRKSSSSSSNCDTTDPSSFSSSSGSCIPHLFGGMKFASSDGKSQRDGHEVSNSASRATIPIASPASSPSRGGGRKSPR